MNDDVFAGVGDCVGAVWLDPQLVAADFDRDVAVLVDGERGQLGAADSSVDPRLPEAGDRLRPA